MTTIVERIKAAYENDQVSNRIAQTADELPISFETVTDEWLTAVLCARTPGAKVLSHTLGPKDNGSSNRRKIYMEYNQAGLDAGLPKAVFCKATHDLANRVVLGVSGGALGEVTFYRQIRPILDIEAPVPYYAHLDPDSFNSLIMLGDLTDEAQEFCNHNTNMTEARAMSQMRQLGKLHGACYSDPVLRERIQKFATFREFWNRSLAFGFREGCLEGFKAAEEVIPPRLFKREAEIWPATEQSIIALDSLPHTLAHNDVHLKNWYVAGNGEMGLGDWQCCGRAHWGRDLIYTMTTALTVENRRKWQKDLITYYLEELAAHGGPRVDYDTAFTYCRQQLLGALAYWTITLCPSPDIPDMQPRDITLEFIRRLTVAMDDMDTLDVK
ncbi:phosphotransferase [Acidocella sp. KAb 2-4]|uniref:phosphotransferase n=1 Tax=Acidocella sp. KAb 2-4 TaxID=2885158 RepID=UPI001D07CC17|nr:phosphotransferase [Acidocella sp. KAb 2-4]MCB5945628.1 phosphotransferase [Acidocella sp. KAb 2-4]